MQLIMVALWEQSQIAVLSQHHRLMRSITSMGI